MCRPRVAISRTATASAPPSGLPAPKAHDDAHNTAPARAPSAMPTTGKAVMTPRPTPADVRTGKTVANANALVTERITR